MNATRVFLILPFIVLMSFVSFRPQPAFAETQCTGTKDGKGVTGICVATCPDTAISVSSQACSGATPTCCGAYIPFTETPVVVGSATPKTLEQLDPLKSMTFYAIIQNVIRTFLGFVGALALLVFVYAGITWMTAGSTDRVQKAKDTLKYAVIGLALIIFSYAITMFFFRTLGGG